MYWMQKNVADSNTKEFQPVKLDFPLFSMSQWSPYENSERETGEIRAIKNHANEQDRA